MFKKESTKAVFYALEITDFLFNIGALLRFMWSPSSRKIKYEILIPPGYARGLMIRIWTTRNYLTDSENLYLQFFEGGSGRVGSSPGRLIDCSSF